MSYDEIEVCAQNIDTILSSIAIITIGRVFVITYKKKRIFTLTSYDFCFSIPIPLKVEMTIFVIHNC